MPSPEEVQESLRWQHIFEETRQNLMNRLDRRYPGCAMHFSIAQMIHQYFRRKTDRAKRLEAKTSHEKHVLRVLDYLEQNYNENDFTDRDPVQYQHYYVKIP